MLRRTKAAPAPADLLDQIRAAQAAHAQAIADANAKLVEAHTGVYSTAADRINTIDEQVKLLKAEREGLDKVVAQSAAAPVAGQ